MSCQVDLKQCHYLVDLALDKEAPREPRYAANKEEWSIIVVKPFLDASRSVLFFFPLCIVYLFC